MVLSEGSHALQTEVQLIGHVEQEKVLGVHAVIARLVESSGGRTQKVLAGLFWEVGWLGTAQFSESRG